MYEVSTALKFLAPRLRKLSYSIISILSVVVITTVVWLTIVFFSATEGFETRWTEKLTNITAPVRITPTDAYYNSYYNLIDSQSLKSNYSSKSIKEKLNSSGDPYDISVDPELPEDFPKPLLDKNGKFVDLIGEVQDAVKNVGATCMPFDMAFANLKLRLIRKSRDAGLSQQLLSQASYLLNYDPEKKAIASQLIKLKPSDLINILTVVEEFPSKNLSSYLTPIFNAISIESLKVNEDGWILPLSFIANGQKFKGYLNGPNIYLPSDIQKYQIQGFDEGTLQKVEGKIIFTIKDGKSVTLSNPQIIIDNGTTFEAKLQSIPNDITSYKNLEFHLQTKIQGEVVSGISKLDDLDIDSIKTDEKGYLFLENIKLNLPSQSVGGAGIILPTGFRESGVLVGDRGYISYFAPSISQLQEQKLNVYVAGFYDPGIIPIGGRLLLASDDVVSHIRAVEESDIHTLPTGLNINFPNFRDARKISSQLRDILEKKGLSPYFKVESYDEYDFSKNILQQLKSEKNLFSLIAIIIVIVACSNIISMLIILVHDKYKEIAIMRALGATKLSVGFIFGFSGFLMGAIGSILGTLLGCLTVKNISGLLSFLGKLQGYEVLNPVIYGDVLSTEVSSYAVILVVVATATISTIAGIVAALQASRQNTSEALRTE